MCVCARGWFCAGRFYSLCVSSFSLSPSRHCVPHQPPSIPQSFEKVGALFLFFCCSFVSESFPYWNREKQRKKTTLSKDKPIWSEIIIFFLSKKRRELIFLKLLRWWSGLPTQQSAFTGLVCRTLGIAFTPWSMFSAWYDRVVMETRELGD